MRTDQTLGMVWPVLTTTTHQDVAMAKRIIHQQEAQLTRLEGEVKIAGLITTLARREIEGHLETDDPGPHQ